MLLPIRVLALSLLVILPALGGSPAQAAAPGMTSVRVYNQSSISLAKVEVLGLSGPDVVSEFSFKDLPRDAMQAATRQPAPVADNVYVRVCPDPKAPGIKYSLAADTDAPGSGGRSPVVRAVTVTLRNEGGRLAGWVLVCDSCGCSTRVPLQPTRPCKPAVSAAELAGQIDAAIESDTAKAPAARAKLEAVIAAAVRKEPQQPNAFKRVRLRNRDQRPVSQARGTNESVPESHDIPGNVPPHDAPSPSDPEGQWKSSVNILEGRFEGELPGHAVSLTICFAPDAQQKIRKVWGTKSFPSNHLIESVDIDVAPGGAVTAVVRFHDGRPPVNWPESDFQSDEDAPKCP